MSEKARADIPPPPDYVEQCTVAKQASSGLTCQECATSRVEAPGTCGVKLGQGFAFGCRTRGATAWREVWCRAEQGADAGAARDGGTPDQAGPRGTLSPASLDGGATSAEPAVVKSALTVDHDALDEDGCSALGRRNGSGLSLTLLLAGLLITRRKRR